MNKGTLEEYINKKNDVERLSEEKKVTKQI